MAIANFNRIVHIKFFTKQLGILTELPQLAITCPRKGRKPAIEITGSFTTEDSLPPFNVAIKNLYMDIPSMEYPEIKVTAGYEGNLQSFTGSILTMYQEQPGPEGRTIIQCVTGTTKTWIDQMVTLQYDTEGFKLTDALTKIASALGMRLITSESVKLMVSKISLQFEGKAQDAIAKLKNIFTDEKLVITVRGEELRAYSLKDSKGINDVYLAFMSAPPQQQAGDDGTVYSTIIAPWIPTLRPGDKLTYNTWQYMKNFSISKANQASIIVDNIQFHFGTVGSVNQMTVQGHAV